MFRSILFWLLAGSSALIATQAISDPRQQTGSSGVQMHGSHDGSHRMRARSRRFGPAWGWPAYELPSQDYPVALEAPRADFGDYRCDYYDCTYSYHPLGREPIGEPSPRSYVIAPSAKIIHIDPINR